MENDFILINLKINGEEKHIHIKKNWTLLYVLREILSLTGTKYGCGTNDCGACRVLIDGDPKNSCVLPARNLEGKEIITVEGLLDFTSGEGKLNTIQQSFVDVGAIQCGFCTPGMIITTTALLQGNPDPSEEEIRTGLENNLCRCTGYVKIVDAVKLAASRLKEAVGE